MGSFKLNNELFEYYIQKGKVIQIDGRTATNISSSKGTDGSITGISSQSVNHQDIYLEDEAGKQFVVNIYNWNISAINGHEMLFIWLQNSRHKNYAYIYNRTLDTWRYCDFKPYFNQSGGTGGCLILIFGIIASCTIPALLYSNDNTVFPWVLFFIMMAVTIISFIIYTSKAKQGNNLAEALKNKMEEIFNSVK